MASGSTNYNNEPNMGSVESKVDEVKVVSDSIMAKVNTLADKATLDNINSYIASLSKQSTTQSILDKVNTMSTSVVKSVQRGVLYTTRTSWMVTVPIGIINPLKSILFVEQSMSRSWNIERSPGGKTHAFNLTDNKFDVVISKDGIDYTLAWQVIEFY